MWQKCPICNGTGRVPDETIATYGVTKKCNVCKGRKIISELTGEPPIIVVYDKLEDIKRYETFEDIKGLDFKIKNRESDTTFTIGDSISDEKTISVSWLDDKDERDYAAYQLNVVLGSFKDGTWYKTK